MTPRDFRRRAEAVRSIPLEIVLTHWGVERDRHDRHQWRTERGPLSVTGAKFFNWHSREGGGGAIDLVMHFSGCEVHAAVEWLERQLGSVPTAASSTAAYSRPSSTSASCGDAPVKPGGLRLPAPNLANLARVRRYLTEQRYLVSSQLSVDSRPFGSVRSLSILAAARDLSFLVRGESCTGRSATNGSGFRLSHQP